MTDCESPGEEAAPTDHRGVELEEGDERAVACPCSEPPRCLSWGVRKRSSLLMTNVAVDRRLMRPEGAATCEAVAPSDVELRNDRTALTGAPVSSLRPERG